VEGLQVIYLECEDAPYVVKNAAYGRDPEKVALEVPWREGTAVRSARHSDLIRVLVPRLRVPEVEAINPTCRARFGSNPPGVVELTSLLYLVPTSRDLLVIPYHRCKASIRLDERDPKTEGIAVRFEAIGVNGSPWLSASNTELSLTGPGSAYLHVLTEMDVSALRECQKVTAALRLGMVPGDISCPLEMTLSRLPSKSRDYQDWGTHQTTI